MALASWRWGCRRCGGCCCACCCRARGCCTETLAFGAFALAHTRSHPRGPGERRPRDIGIEINNKVQRVREGGGLIDVEGLAGVSHSPARGGGVRGKEAELQPQASAPPPGHRVSSWRACARGCQDSYPFSPLPLLLFSLNFLGLSDEQSWEDWWGVKNPRPQTMVGKRLASPPHPVFAPGLGAVYCLLSRGCLTAKPCAGLGS